MKNRWQADAFELLQGDALELLREMPDESVDALITDPPYSSGGSFRGDRTQEPVDKYVRSGLEVIRGSFTGDNRDQRSWCYWMALWLSEAARVVKTGGLAMVFSDWRQLPMCSDAFQAGGFVWRGIVVWDKTEAAKPTPGRFRHQAEFIVWGSKGPLRASTASPWAGVFRVPVTQDDKFHMTGKPTPLMEWLAGVVPRGGKILDPFAGSGTTGVGAIRAGRRFIGIEREAGHCSVALARLADAEAQLKIPLDIEPEPEQAPLFEAPAAEPEGEAEP